VYGFSPAYWNAGNRMCLVILGMSAVPSLKFRSLRAISSALSIHFEPSGSFLLTRSITALALLSIPKQRALRRKRMAGFR
jgi:hypothetical protein